MHTFFLFIPTLSSLLHYKQVVLSLHESQNLGHVLHDFDLLSKKVPLWQLLFLQTYLTGSKTYSPVQTMTHFPNLRIVPFLHL